MSDELPNILEISRNDSDSPTSSTETHEENNKHGESVLERQYSLIHQSYSDFQTKKRASIFCVDEKSRPWILRLSFLFVIALGLTISYFEVRFSTYKQKHFEMTTGDQILFPVSSYLNKKVRFASHTNTTSDLRLYVLKQKPNISSVTYNYDSGVSFQMPSWSFQYFGFYLLSGTSVRISICADLQVQFYLLKGQKKVKHWTQEILYNDYDYHQHIFPKQTCTKLSNFKSHILTVTHSDYYYILFSTSNGWRFFTQVSVLLQFNRTYYDLSNLKYTCRLSNSSCVTSLEEGSNDISMIEAGDVPMETGYPFEKIDLTVMPIPRHSFYFKYFCGMYSAIALLAVSYILWRVSVNQSNSSSEREPLVSAENARYSSDKRTWLVVSDLQRTSSKSGTCTVEERETGSLLEESMNNFCTESTNSENFMRRQNGAANYGYSNPYNNTQQLLDTCLTSAGASAI